MIEIADTVGGVTFGVHVTPRASRDAIGGEYQGTLKVRVTAPPVDDRANEAVRRVLAERLKVPLSAVKILSGEKSRNKRVQILGIGRQSLMELLP
jgi:uncharacterized protein (TIGR00251 family)